MNRSESTSIFAWLISPRSQYVPAADVKFGNGGFVQPSPLPATSMQFPNATFNKMLNIPSTQSIYDVDRTKRIF